MEISDPFPAGQQSSLSSVQGTEHADVSRKGADIEFGPGAKWRQRILQGKGTRAFPVPVRGVQAFKGSAEE